MSIKIMSIHHVMITIGDIEVAKQFYGTILGLEEADCPVDDGKRAWFKLGNQELHVNLHEHYKTGFGHFAISIEPGKYHEYVENIKNSGYEKMSESQKYIDGSYKLFIDDPFGNTVEITDLQVNA